MRKVKFPIDQREAELIEFHLAGAKEGRLNVRVQEACRKRGLDPKDYESFEYRNFDEQAKSAAIVLTPRTTPLQKKREVVCPNCQTVFDV